MNRKQRRRAQKLGHIAGDPSRVTAVPPGHTGLLALARSHHEAGRLAEAETLYRRVLAQQPDNADAYASLGVAFGSQRKFEEAIAAFRQAMRIKPNLAEAHSNLGKVLQIKGNLEEALASYDRALTMRLDDSETLNNRGVVLSNLNRLEEALASFDRALSLRPDYAEALNNRGIALRNLKRLEEALASYDRALSLRPDYTDALNNRSITLWHLNRPEEALASCDQALAVRPDYAEALNNRGLALRDLKRLDEALASFDRALAVRLDYADALTNRGNTLRDLKRFEEALASYDRALTVWPDYAEALNNRGNALGDLNRFEEALASYDRALTVRPDYAEALKNRGNALRDLKRIEEALASYDNAIGLKDDYADALLGRALCKLQLGQFLEGWSDYEWRWGAADWSGKRPDFATFAIWHGEYLEHRRLLVFREQGLGDIIQYARYLPLLVNRGPLITFLAPANLTRLLRPLTNEIEIISSIGPERKFDFQCALMSLPHRFGTELASVPNSIPYLRAEDALIARWRERIGAHDFKVGIAWQGNPQGRIDKGRSIPLTEFFPLGRIPGVRLISLQKEHGLEQLRQLPDDVTIETLGEDFDNGPDAFVDTAAAMKNLDLIVTSDTSIAHLAGALGRPTWVALSHVPDWRWLLDREDSPWYPTMRLFRQSERQNWQSVFARIERELRSLRSCGT